MVARTTPTTPAKRVVRRTATPKPSTEGTAYVPSEDVHKKYVGRKVWGTWDFDILRTAMEQKRNVLLMGDTGAGKTMLGEAFASKERMQYYSLPCDVSIDPTALFGKMTAGDHAGEYVWQDGPVTSLVRNGGVLNISEVNFMSPKIAASLYPLMDGRGYIPLLGHKGEVVRRHKDTLIIADMNPQYRGTMDLNAAFKNRFSIRIPWGYEDHVEAKLVPSTTLRRIAKKIRASQDIMTPVSTNMLMEFCDFVQHEKFGVDFAIGNFVSAFELSERGPVENIFKLEKSSLDRDLATLLGLSTNDADVEDIEFEFGEDI